MHKTNRVSRSAYRKWRGDPTTQKVLATLYELQTDVSYISDIRGLGRHQGMKRMLDALDNGTFFIDESLED